MSASEPAFPSTWQETTPTGLKLDQHSPGMSLRDWFAGQALAGLLASKAERSPEEEKGVVAHVAYEYADDMMKVREESKD